MKKILKKTERFFKNFFIAAVLLPLRNQKNIPIPDPGSVDSVLVLRPDRIGDFIVSVPALRAIKGAMKKDAVFTVVAGSRAKEPAKMYFRDSRIIVYKKGVWGIISVCLKLIKNKYDVTVNLHSYPFSVTSAFMTLCAGSKTRIGFSQASGRKIKAAEKIYNKGVRLNDDSMHEVLKNRILADMFVKTKPQDREPLKDMYVVPEIPEKIREKAADYFMKNGLLSGGVLIGVHPTLVKKDNRWKKENYIELCRKLMDEQNAKIVVFSGFGETEELNEFREMAESSGVMLSYYPYKDIISIMAGAGLCRLFICNDSGVMHACALVTGLIAVFGPMDPERWGPLGPGKIAVLQAEDRQCDSVAPMQVYEKAAELLKSENSSPAEL
ncbi:MAG: glycosyltransferase family 9 protein [Candidatus Goldiibacteriota bacterium]